MASPSVAAGTAEKCRVNQTAAGRIELGDKRAVKIDLLESSRRRGE